MSQQTLSQDHKKDSLDQYSSYQNSNFDWLNKIPDHWEERRVKTATTIDPEVLPESYDEDYEIEYIDIGSVDSKGNITDIEKLKFEEAPSRARKIVKEGDSIISTVRTYLKAIAYLDSPSDNQIVSTGFTVLRPQEDLFPKYLAYFMQSDGFIHSVMKNSKGVTYPAIATRDLADISIAMPPKDEQKTIVKFIDRETERIDNLISQKKKLVELLNEKREAVINDRVTHGLGSEEMKDCQLNWVDRVPKSWNLQKLKQVSDIYPSNVDKKEKEEETPVHLCNYTDVYHHKEIGSEMDFMEATAKESDIKKFQLEKGDVIITKDSEAWDDICVPTYVSETIEDVICGYHLAHIKPYSSKIEGKYLYYMLKTRAVSHHFHTEAEGVTRYGISKGSIKEAPVFLPSKDKQKEIIEAIEQETEAIDEIIQRIETAVEKLRDYRSTLITEAVTGQIDVRGEV